MENNYYSELKNFVRATALYPPSEICSGTYGKKAAAKEKRLIDICEDLYRFENQTIPAMREAFKEFDTMIKISNGVEIKALAATSIAGKLIFFTDNAIKALEMMHKKDQALMYYYNDFKITRHYAEGLIREWTLILLKRSQHTGAEIQIMITDAVKSQKEAHK
jgi:hypothetical protein